MACRGLTKKGKPCGFKVRWAQDLCINHDPTMNPKLASERAAEISRRVRAGRIAPRELLGAAMSLTDRTSIQATMDVALRLYLGGHLKREKYRDIIHGCSAAARNFDQSGDTLEGPKPQEHKWDNYFIKVGSLLDTVAPLLVEDEEPNPDATIGYEVDEILHGEKTDGW